MSSKFKLAVCSQQPDKGINWEACILCQQESNEDLTFPGRSTKADKNAGYVTLAANLQEFQALGSVPLNVNLSALDEGNGIEETLMNRAAGWHKSCYLQFSSSRLERAKKRPHQPGDNAHVSPVKTRSKKESYSPGVCIFCGCVGSRYHTLNKVSSEQCSQDIYENAVKLKDTQMLGKLGGSGCSSARTMKALYHNKCKVKYCKRARKSTDAPNLADDERAQASGLALAGLVSNMKAVRESSNEPPVFKMAAVTKEFSERLEELGFKSDVHSTRLRERLLEECPELEHVGTAGQDVLIAFKKDIDFSIRSDCSRHYDGEGFHLAEAAEIVRKDMFNLPVVDWSDMSTESQRSTVPTSLITLLKMILNGPATRSSDDDGSSQIALTLAQLISFHSVKRNRKGNVVRHDRSRENPVALFVAAKLYGETRKKKLVDMTYDLGLSISYDRLQTMLSEKANEACNTYHEEGKVCPRQLKLYVFPTFSVDNYDHNPSSTTSKSAKHGTAISVMQHPTYENEGVVRDIPEMVSVKNCKKVRDLPEEYAVVPACFLPLNKGTCKPISEPKLSETQLDSPLVDELEWLEGCTVDETCVTWAQHHSKLDPNTLRLKSRIVLLPLFDEVAHTSSMMLHTLNVVKGIAVHLKWFSSPVVVADQQLYAILKLIQFCLPDKYGEDKFCILMGGMHIELATLRTVGNWLDGSGWVSCLVEAGITTQGRAESMISASHLTRTKYAHEVTAAALYALQEAYECFLDSSDDPLTFEQWKEAKRSSSPQFRFWDIALNLELLFFQLVRSQRTGDFKLYIAALQALVLWFFGLDHINYARWLPVHIKDLITLEDSNPELYEKFLSGRFVARKTCKAFSAMALDQAHEQLNAQLKGDGGIIGLTENPTALKKFMLYAPELLEIVGKFEENSLHAGDLNANNDHHNVTKAARTSFLDDKKSLQDVIRDKGNPFLEESDDLYALDSKSFASDEVKETVMNIEKNVTTQYNTYVKERLESNTLLVTDPLKLNKFPLFSSKSQKSKTSKTKAQVKALKANCSLFSRLYIATCANRPGDLDSFFSFENEEFPPSLSIMGQMRTGNKSDLAKRLVKTSESCIANTAPEIDAKIFDGAVLLHMLKPGTCVTFEEYAEKIFFRYLRNEGSGVQRMDVIFDRYLSDSLKTATREKRGSGSRIKVALSTRIPKGWENFLRDSENKTALFHLLAEKIAELSILDTQIFATLDDTVICSPIESDISSISPCNHEEADTRLFLHVTDAVRHGYKRVMLRTCDTDVLVLAVHFSNAIDGLEELWLHFGTGKNVSFVAAHEIANCLGSEKSASLLGFHSFSGCDTVSFFNGVGKSTAFNTLLRFPENEFFEALQRGETNVVLEPIEKFVVNMYSKTLTCESVNECRKILFTKQDRQIECIPPTQDALVQHILRASLQAQVWQQAVKRNIDAPDPGQFGWKKTENGWVPHWRTKPKASEACEALVKCKCKKNCEQNRCGCLKKGLSCCDLCSCPCSCNL